MIPALVGFGCLSPPPETVDIRENPLHNSLLFAEGEVIGDHGDEFAIGGFSFDVADGVAEDGRHLPAKGSRFLSCFESLCLVDVSE